MKIYEYLFRMGSLKVNELEAEYKPQYKWFIITRDSAKSYLNEKEIGRVIGLQKDRIYLTEKNDVFVAGLFIADKRNRVKKHKDAISRIQKEIEILQSVGENDMKKYYIGCGDISLTESNAVRKCESIDGAIKELKKIRREILSGKFDKEYFPECDPMEMIDGMMKEMRRIEAERHFVYFIDYTPSGAVRAARKI